MICFCFTLASFEPAADSSVVIKDKAPVGGYLSGEIARKFVATMMQCHDCFPRRCFLKFLGLASLRFWILPRVEFSTSASGALFRKGGACLDLGGSLVRWFSSWSWSVSMLNPFEHRRTHTRDRTNAHKHTQARWMICMSIMSPARVLPGVSTWI